MEEAEQQVLFPEFINQHKYKLILLILGIFLLILGIAISLIFSSKDQSKVEIIPETSVATTILVHVAGAVEKPGLYKLSSDSRVNDALISSGGLSVEADRNWFDQNINLAQKLQDGIKLYFPSQTEIAALGVRKDVVLNSNANFSFDTQVKININTADMVELDKLSGIGPSLAQKIIDYRTTNGFFKSIEDITKVPGIGQKLLEAIKNKITI